MLSGERKQAEYREQELALETSLTTLCAPVKHDSALSVERVFELANRTHSLYLTRNAAERADLLKSVLLNCTTDGGNSQPCI